MMLPRVGGEYVRPGQKRGTFVLSIRTQLDRPPCKERSRTSLDRGGPAVNEMEPPAEAAPSRAAPLGTVGRWEP